LPVIIARPENASVVRCAPSVSVWAVVNAGFGAGAALGVALTMAEATLLPIALMATTEHE
jgi:hypothetical protein